MFCTYFTFYLHFVCIAAGDDEAAAAAVAAAADAVDVILYYIILYNMASYCTIWYHIV